MMPQLLAVRVVGERLDDVRARMHEFAVQLRHDLGVLQHDLRDEGAGLQIAAPLELEQIAFGADHRAAFRAVPAALRSRAHHVRTNELDDRLEIGRNRLSGVGEGNALADELVARAVPAPRAGDPRRSTACVAIVSSMATTRAPRLDHLREPAGRERRHRHSILDSLVLRRRRELERHGLSEQARLGDDSLDGGSELAERRLGEVRSRGEPLRQAGERRLQQLEPRSAALVNAGARAMRRKSSAAASGTMSKFPAAMIRAHRGRDHGVSLVGVQLDRKNALHIRKRVRAAPITCGSVRKVSGSCRLRGCASHR